MFRSHPSRPGRFSAAWLIFLASLLVLGGLVAVLALDLSWLLRPKTRSIVVFCAAGLRKPVEEAARAYQNETGVEVHLQYGGSNTLLSQLEVSDRADLYIPADDSYVQTGRDKELLDEALPLATMRPVLVVKEGNPKQIQSLDDLLTRKLRVAQANPEAAAVGKMARDVLTSAGKWDAFERCIVVTKPTVNDAALDVTLGAVDAAVVWDATVKQIKGLQIVPYKRFASTSANLSACVVRATKQPAAALRFARYLSSKDRGLPLFEKHGFTVGEGDQWTATPELKMFAGSMLKPAIEETVTRFEQREGVKVTRIYNGCGILVAQMKVSNDAPDIYFACDKEFMDQVQDLFDKPVTVSGNQLVILVHKGNPHNIKRLKDLGKPNLKVGIGHEKQCAMGVLTQQTLNEDRSTAAVMKNVSVQSPTGDMLVNQMRTGSLDAAIAYISNAAGSGDKLEPIAIDIPCAFAVQPFAVSKESRFKQLSERLLRAILAEDSHKRFLAYGFTWKQGGKTSETKKP